MAKKQRKELRKLPKKASASATERLLKSMAEERQNKVSLVPKKLRTK